MEKNWAVECWGDLWNYGSTELFYTKREAVNYFKSIRKKLNCSNYIFSRTSIIDKENPENALYDTNVKEELV